MWELLIQFALTMATYKWHPSAVTIIQVAVLLWPIGSKWVQVGHAWYVLK